MEQKIVEGQFIHPKSKVVVVGVKLVPGVTLKSGDVCYYHGSNDWIKCPIPGTRLGEVQALWIRPLSRSKSKPN